MAIEHLSPRTRKAQKALLGVTSSPRTGGRLCSLPVGELPRGTANYHNGLLRSIDHLPQTSVRYDDIVGHKEVVRKESRHEVSEPTLSRKLSRMKNGSKSYYAEIQEECAGRVALNWASTPNVLGRSAPDSGCQWSPVVWNTADFIRLRTNWSPPGTSSLGPLHRRLGPGQKAIIWRAYQS